MTKTKEPLDIPEDVKEDLESFIDDSYALIKDNFKKLSDEIADFDKRHQERKDRFKNGNRRRTNGRII